MISHFLKFSGPVLLSLALLQSCNNNHSVASKERSIEVTGSAEIEIQPDQVYYSVTLQEYKKDKKKISLADQETILLKKALAAGIKKEDIKMDNMYSYGYYYDYWYSRKRNDYYANKTYSIKVATPDVLDKILSGGDSLNYSSVSIDRFESSRKQELRDSLKVKALKAARKKAEMLLVAAGEQIGKVITITEIESPDYSDPYDYYRPYRTNYASNVAETYNMGNDNGVAVSNMKYRYEMKVSYAIQ